MTDHIAANLPAIDFAQTITFYNQLGFSVHYQSEQWLILHNDQFKNGLLEIEFFPYSNLDANQSYFSASVWVDDLDALYASWSSVDFANFAAPTRLTEIEQMGQLRLFNLIDINGSLLRCMSLQS